MKLAWVVVNDTISSKWKKQSHSTIPHSPKFPYKGIRYFLFTISPMITFYMSPLSFDNTERCSLFFSMIPLYPVLEKGHCFSPSCWRLQKKVCSSSYNCIHALGRGD